jgi:hypothetical protein
MIVRLTTPSASWPLVMQTPGSSGEWDDVSFLVDRSGTLEADAWVVYEEVPEETTTLCPPDRTLLITGEPPMIKTYRPEYLAQFARVLTCHDIRGSGVIRDQQALPWHYGRFFEASGAERFVECYDSLAAHSPFERKERSISIVCSAKRKRDGHRKRDEFVTELERSGIPGLDIFGRGRAREAVCKRDAILPYRYHIVLENSECPDYWTEKLADAYLGGAFPFYWGCTNIEKYFPTGSFVRIDIGNPSEALRTIRDTIAAGTFERALPLLEEARDLVLNRYNLFPTIVSLFRALPSTSGTERIPVTLQPERNFTLKGRIRRFWSGPAGGLR